MMCAKAGEEKNNKNGGENITEYSVQINPRFLCAPIATSNCPTNSSREQMKASRSPTIYGESLTSVLFQPLC